MLKTLSKIVFSFKKILIALAVIEIKKENEKIVINRIITRKDGSIYVVESLVNEIIIKLRSKRSTDLSKRNTILL